MDYSAYQTFARDTLGVAYDDIGLLVTAFSMLSPTKSPSKQPAAKSKKKPA